MNLSEFGDKVFVFIFKRFEVKVSGFEVEVYESL